jgi:hypothetical protein
MLQSFKNTSAVIEAGKRREEAGHSHAQYESSVTHNSTPAAKCLGFWSQVNQGNFSRDLHQLALSDALVAPFFAGGVVIPIELIFINHRVTSGHSN